MADLCYGLTSLQDIDELCDIVLHSFWTREPMSLGLGLTWQDHRKATVQRMAGYADSGVSFLVRDRNSNNKIVGCHLCKVLSSDNRNMYEDVDVGECEMMQINNKIEYDLEEVVDFFDKFKVNKLLGLAILCVDEEYSGRGIGRKLVQLTEERGKQVGAELMVAQATNVYSQKLFDRLDFETYYVMDYGSYEVKGRKVFDLEKLGKNTCVKIMAKRI
ncbi:uncharacterized protein LOC143026527 [Oratosquilla oratoria]|uniref:uncharacterized protein LOC143026527 n=1 Tax=Oratosquilla oratoria TaxID=337810 RepID=UPI003F76ED6F